VWRDKSCRETSPKELLDRLHATRQALDYAGKPFDRPVYDARAVVVSLRPNVLIVSLRESPTLEKGDPIRDAFYDWDQKE
jgi:hypothetical protein